MYEHDGQRYYVVDGHVHYWDASPENWIPGQEQYAKGWIDCFYAYHGLGPEDTRWPYEQYQKYPAELMIQHLFDEGHVDVAIFQPTYLKQWYKDGFNTTERNAALAAEHPGRFVVNGRFDPRDGDAGLEQLEADAERYGLRGVKLYSAEWRGESRGWNLKSDDAARYLQACQRLGITNIHLHKGPTIWPLDKDAFDVSDVDFAATNFPELNFIVEHVGLPRIEDFCFMATQEPNVYAGLAVVVGGLMHARPRMFAKVMGELMFWLGEDKLLFGSDYAIWEPAWQVERFAAWQMPAGDEFSDYGLLTTDAKRKIFGLNAARLYDLDVPDEFRIPEEEPATLAPS
jgi:predicted TIM-barrel fold metal-dependent hydrolase